MKISYNVDDRFVLYEYYPMQDGRTNDSFEVDDADWQEYELVKKRFDELTKKFKDMIP